MECWIVENLKGHGPFHGGGLAHYSNTPVLQKNRSTTNWTDSTALAAFDEF
jgi:hypothetical protein